MSRTFDKVYVPKEKTQSLLITKENAAQMLKSSEILLHKAVAAELSGKSPQDRDSICEAMDLLKLQPVILGAIKKLGGEAVLRLGWSRDDIIVHLKKKDPKFKDEIFYPIYKEYSKLLTEKPKERPKEAVYYDLTGDDKEVVKKNVDKFGTATVESMDKLSEKKDMFAPNQPIGLFAHGAIGCKDDNLIVGTALAGKGVDALVALVKDRLPDNYKGVLTLYGCFTASGDANAGDEKDHDYNSLAQRVYKVLKVKCKDIRVRGVPDSWSHEEDGQMKAANKGLGTKTTKSGQTLKTAVDPQETDQYKAFINSEKFKLADTAINKLQTDIADSQRVFIKFCQTSLQSKKPFLEPLHRGDEYLQGDIWTTYALETFGLDNDADCWESFERNIERIKESGYTQAPEVLKRYKALNTELEGKWEKLLALQKWVEDKKARFNPQISNYTRTFRDKA